jgi:hypothetical protein
MATAVHLLTIDLCRFEQVVGGDMLACSVTKNFLPCVFAAAIASWLHRLIKTHRNDQTVNLKQLPLLEVG